MRVIGLGNRMRRDDGAGLEVIRRLRDGLPKDLRDQMTADCTGDVSELIALWDGQRRVVVVDAALSGLEPGTVSWHDGFDTMFSGRGMAASSHALNLRDAVALGETLGQLPAQLAVVAIEGESFAYGDRMTAPVEAAVTRVTAQLKEQLAGRISTWDQALSGD